MRRIQKILTITSYFFYGIVFFVVGLFAADHLGYINFYKPFVVLSGSMEPTIATGSVVFVQTNSAGYQVGDVITFNQGKDTPPTTHRIHKLESQNEKIVYQTKGDANKSTDPGVIQPEAVIGKVGFSIPYIGYIADFAKSPQGFIVFIIIPSTIIVYEELKNLKRETLRLLSLAYAWFKTRKQQTKAFAKDSLPFTSLLEYTNNQKLACIKVHEPKAHLGKNHLLVGILPVVFGIVLISQTHVTKAAFSDTEISLHNLFQAATSFSDGDDNLPQECSHLKDKITDTIIGTPGNDKLEGSSKSELIIGLEGNDIIDSGGGDDCIVGGGGDDSIESGSGDDVILGGPGNDWIESGSGDDVVYAGTGYDRVEAGTGDDIIYGDEDADNLDGGSGKDKIYGGDGNDTLKGGSGDDQLYGEDGNDALTGDSGNDYLDGGSGTNWIDGNSGTDTCVDATHSDSCEL